VRDRPGELARICQHVAAAGANILDVTHNRAFAGLEVGGVEIELTLDEHIAQLLQVLRADGIEAIDLINN
jgi:threonine dehydratase